jgi:hypothetical protein
MALPRHRATAPFATSEKYPLLGIEGFLHFADSFSS